MSHSMKLLLPIALVVLVGSAFGAGAANSATDPVSGLPLLREARARTATRCMEFPT